MTRTTFQQLKQQRQVWAWALIVGLLLVLVGHAPVFPVVGGCALAVAFSTLRTAFKSKLSATPVRGGR